MPAYELTLIMKCLERPQTVSTIKRAGKLILENGGILRSFENLGELNTPYKMYKESKGHTRARYFLVNFDAPTTVLPPLHDHMKRDLDVIRGNVFRKETLLGKPCDTQDCDYGELTDEMRTRNNRYVKEYVKKL